VYVRDNFEDVVEKHLGN